MEDLQDVARGNLIFGLHVHVGIPDRDLAIELYNEARYFLPHILALTTSSPFWMGRKTGLMSTRCSIFKAFPRTGVPEAFRAWGHFESYVDTLVTAGPFAWIRHPIYTGLFLMLIALAIGLGHVSRLLVAVPLYALGTAIRVQVEERLLRTAFHSAYDEYAGRVKRFVPGVF